MIRKYLYIILIGAGLTACSSFSPKTWKSDTLEINESKGEILTLEDEIRPYRDSLSESMNKVVGFAKENLVKGRPCSDLNNWTADALLKDQAILADQYSPNMSLLNLGGLRSSINSGNITVGDIFSLMPFDNTVVWVKMPISSLKDIEAYLQKSGGEPIGNAKLTSDGLVLNEVNTNSDYFWIVTSDYLMNGGDNMSFFNQKLEVIYTDKLLRDSFLDQVESEVNLVIDKKCRINVE